MRVRYDGPATFPEMPHRHGILLLAVLLCVAGCTEEGEGSATATGVGLVALPWWVLIAVGVAVGVFLYLRGRGRH